MRRLFAAGKLSEVFGEKVLKLDMMSRNIGFGRYGKKKWEKMTEESKKVYSSFINGINDAAANMKILPIEFWLTRSTFENIT